MNTNRKLSLDVATKIANSQKDLGGKSKADMVVALAGNPNSKTEGEDIGDRLDAYAKLDGVTKFIVDTILSADDLEDAESDLSYAIGEMTNALNALN